MNGGAGSHPFEPVDIGHFRRRGSAVASNSPRAKPGYNLTHGQRAASVVLQRLSGNCIDHVGFSSRADATRCRHSSGSIRPRSVVRGGMCLPYTGRNRSRIFVKLRPRTSKGAGLGLRCVDRWLTVCRLLKHSARFQSANNGGAHALGRNTTTYVSHATPLPRRQDSGHTYTATLMQMDVEHGSHRRVQCEVLCIFHQISKSLNQRKRGITCPRGYLGQCD